MKPLRRLLTIIIILLSTVVFAISMILLPIQYLSTGRTDIIDIEVKIIDALISRINPDK